MYNIINFEENTKLDNKLFFEYIWQRFYKLLILKQYDRIVLDFNNINFISPLVLTKLCCMGLIAKKHQIILELIFNPTSEIKSYLSIVGFFDIINRYNIMYIEPGLIGGDIDQFKITSAFLCFEGKQLLDKYSKIFDFRKDVTLKDKLKFCVTAEIFGDNYYNKNYEFSQDKIDKSSVLKVISKCCPDSVDNKLKTIQEIALDFVELIHNSIWHGESLCFFALQAGTYRNKGTRESYKKLEVSVADCGIGLYDSLIKKDWGNRHMNFISNYRFGRLNNEKEKNYYSLIESLLFRKEEEMRGLYDLLVNLSERKKIVIYMTNKNLIAVFYHNSIKKLLNGDLELKIPLTEKEDIDYRFSIDISFSL